MWLRSFSHLLTGETLDVSKTSAIIPSEVPLLSHSINIDDMYFARPKDWRMKKRSVFNFRRIYFRPPVKTVSPLQIVEVALQLIFELVEYDRSIHKDEEINSDSKKDPNTVKMWEKETALSKWIAFLDQVSLLQTVDLTKLSEKEKLTIFLNIYHIMILHGNLVL